MCKSISGNNSPLEPVVSLSSSRTLAACHRRDYVGLPGLPPTPRAAWSEIFQEQVSRPTGAMLECAAFRLEQLINQSGQCCSTEGRSKSECEFMKATWNQLRYDMTRTYDGTNTLRRGSSKVAALLGLQPTSSGSLIHAAKMITLLGRSHAPFSSRLSAQR